MLPLQSVEASIAELPYPGDRRVEERPVVGRDEERPGAAAQVLLEPLEGVEIVTGLPDLLAVSDHLVVTAPATSATRTPEARHSTHTTTANSACGKPSLATPRTNCGPTP